MMVDISVVVLAGDFDLVGMLLSYVFGLVCILLPAYLVSFSLFISNVPVLFCRCFCTMLITGPSFISLCFCTLYFSKEEIESKIEDSPER